MIVLEILMICLFIFWRNKALKFYFGLREAKLARGDKVGVYRKDLHE